MRATRSKARQPLVRGMVSEEDLREDLNILHLKAVTVGT